MGSIPGWGIKISYAVWYIQNVKKKKKKKKKKEEEEEERKKIKINLEIPLEVITLRKQMHGFLWPILKFTAS